MKHIFRSWNEHYKMFIYFQHGCYFKDIGGKYTVLSNIDVRAEFWSNEEQGIMVENQLHFEGDIYHTNNGISDFYHVLRFGKQVFEYGFYLDWFGNNIEWCSLLSNLARLKKAGNIHQNKELLGVK